MRIIAILLIVVGVLILAYQGFTYISREPVVDVGPVQVWADRERTVWIPPVVGGAFVIIGAVLLAMGGRRPGDL
jgi:drug/metabolite transporter (DMT)-like permease